MNPAAMNLARDLWLLSALLVMAAITLAMTLAAISELLDQRKGHGQSANWAESELKAATRPRRIERFVYRYHHAFGIAILAGSLLYLALSSGNGLLWPAGAGPLLDVLLPLLTLLHLALLPFGLVMLLRPSLLKRLEAASNRWVDWEGRNSARALRIIIGLYCLAALVMLIAERVRGL